MMQIRELFYLPITSEEFSKFWGESIRLEREELDEDIYADNPELGVSLVIDEDSQLDQISFYSGRKVSDSVEFNRYKGNLPFGLHFDMTCTQIEEILGEPTRENNQMKECLGLTVYPWKLFANEPFEINVTFQNPFEDILTVTVKRKKGRGE